jgi:PBP1b-binding outer membrane lipoprotein LpoB
MTDPKQEKTGTNRPDDAPKGETSPPLPAINFSTFIFSLNSSALVQLGMMEDPITGEKSKNLPLAKQTIDIISMLEEKTKGNLHADEAAMIKNILYDLRIHYVKERG